jgi:hypothetical protein
MLLCPGVFNVSGKGQAQTLQIMQIGMNLCTRGGFTAIHSFEDYGKAALVFGL